MKIQPNHSVTLKVNPTELQAIAEALEGYIGTLEPKLKSTGQEAKLKVAKQMYQSIGDYIQST